MATVRVTNADLGGLSEDLASIPIGFATRAPGVVDRHVNEGNRIAQGLAKRRSGPHGKNYWKRLTGTMTGPLSGEYGPHDGGTPVGAGYRNGPPNLDLPDSADLIGPKLADAVGDLVDDLFDEAGF